jgi:hypothetical protein
MPLDANEKSQILRAVKSLEIPFPAQALNAIDAYGHNIENGSWWMRSANQGKHKDWRNALEPLLLAAREYDRQVGFIEDLQVHATTIAVRNVGGLPLQNMRLTLNLDQGIGSFEENGYGLKSRPYMTAPTPAPDPRRFQVSPQTASVEHGLIPAGETEVFFGVSVRRRSAAINIVPLQWRVASSELRRPLEGEVTLNFQQH